MRIVAALSAVLVALVATAPAAEAKRTLRLTMQLPLKSVLGQSLLQFKSEVEKGTSGEIEVQIFDSAQLYEDKDVPRAVGTGSIDMGVASLARFAADVPAVDVFAIPFLFDTEARTRAAVAPGSPVRGPLDEAIAGTGARVLWWQAYGGTIMLTKGGKPIKAPSDIAGKKVRATGRLVAGWVTSLGGTPVNVAGGDQYFAYQRGTVDVGMTGPDSIKSRKIWEVMDTVTVANVANVEYVVIINDKVFQNLSDAEKSVFVAAAKGAESRLRAEFSQLEKDAIEAGRLNKMTIHVPGAAETKIFRDSTAAAREEFLKASGELGRQVLEAALALP